MMMVNFDLAKFARIFPPIFGTGSVFHDFCTSGSLDIFIALVLG